MTPVSIDPIVVPAVPESESIQGVIEPTGYRILVRIPDLEAQMKRWANLVMPESTRSIEEAAQVVAQVMSLGPDAYLDKVKFPSGPWCKKGDVIVMRAYSGTRMVVKGHMYALINDDSVQGVVCGDPTDIERP